jgi:hypothetical protein
MEMCEKFLHEGNAFKETMEVQTRENHIHFSVVHNTF